MEKNDLYSNCLSYQEYDSTEKTNSYTLNFFDENGKSLETIYLSEDSFDENRIENINISEKVAFFSLILTYQASDGSIRFQNICFFCLKNKTKIINSKFVELQTGEEIYGDFKFVENLDQLNKISNFIVDSFYERRLPISGEYTSVIKELEFVKRAL